MRPPETEEARRRAIAWAVAMTVDTPLAPDQYEGDLLEEYAQGRLTLDQVLGLLNSRVHHLLYHSRATEPLAPAQLAQLLAQAEAYNTQHDITGLLCYSSDGHFVQLLEGTEAAVQELFARIRQDPRHYHVVTLHEQAGPARRFADWRMAFTSTEPSTFKWLLSQLAPHSSQLPRPPQVVTDPHLQQLLDAFSKV